MLEFGQWRSEVAAFVMLEAMRRGWRLLRIARSKTQGESWYLHFKRDGWKRVVVRLSDHRSSSVAQRRRYLMLMHRQGLADLARVGAFFEFGEYPHPKPLGPRGRSIIQ